MGCRGGSRGGGAATNSAASDQGRSRSRQCSSLSLLVFGHVSDPPADRPTRAAIAGWILVPAALARDRLAAARHRRHRRWEPLGGGEAQRRALCVPPGVDVGDGAAVFHQREVQSRRSRSLILFDARRAASAPGPRFAVVATVQRLLTGALRSWAWRSGSGVSERPTQSPQAPRQEQGMGMGHRPTHPTS